MMTRRCFVEPIPEIFAAATKLQQAVEAHLNNNQVEAEQLFFEANDPIIWNFTDFVWGKGCRERFGFVSMEGGPPLLKSADRPQPRMPDAITKTAIIARDGHHCRFCGMPVIDPKIRDIAKRLYPKAVNWGVKNTEQHAAFQCMWLQYDHVLPNARGGDSSIENMVITCAPCNFGRMEATLEEARLIDPRSEFRVDTWSGFRLWDGLERFRTATN